METRQIHVRDLSTVSNIMQWEHEVQSLYFLGLEDFEGDVFISIESDEYSNEAIPLANNTFIIGQPMTKFNVTYTCQIYGVVNDGDKIKLSKRFRLIVDKSNDIQGDSEEYPVDPNFTNGIIEFMAEQKEQAQSEIQATGEAVKASIPSDYTALEQATYNAYPSQTENGNPIYIDDGAKDIPVKELIVDFSPKQEGTGDPSPTNVRAISGHDEFTVIRTGKNVIKWTRATGYTETKNGVTFTVNSDYSITVKGTSTATADFNFARTETLPNGTLYLSGGASNDCHIRWNITTHPADVGNGAVGVKLPADSGNMWVRVMSGKTVDTKVYPMVRVDETATTTYSAPRNRVETLIEFPSSAGMVYGGSLNITTGVLTVNKYCLHIDPTKIPDNYIKFDALTNNVRVGILNLETMFGAQNVQYDSSSAKTGAICDWLPERNRGYSTDEMGYYFYDKRSLYLFVPKDILSAQTASAFKQYLTDNPLYICYDLETPLTYQLTPTEIRTLFMGNSIWVDGETTQINLTYRQDTDTVIDRLTNAIISLGGNV